MKKFLASLICLAMIAPASAQAFRNYPEHRKEPPRYNHQPHRDYRYLAAPIIFGGVISYAIGNGINTIYVERLERLEVPLIAPEIREDADGRVLELRNVYTERCRCYQATWIQVYP
jgi:hypothetical protein